jgi:hypothetical protein
MAIEGSSGVALDDAVSDYQNRSANETHSGRIGKHVRGRFYFAIAAVKGSVELVFNIAHLVFGNFNQRGRAIATNVSTILKGVVGFAIGPGTAVWLHRMEADFFAKRAGMVPAPR